MNRALAFLALCLLTACDPEPSEFELRDGSTSDTGAPEPWVPTHACLVDGDGVKALRVDGLDCDPGTTHACWASEYPEPALGAACCKLLDANTCHMNWGASSCPAGYVRVCTVAAC
jgi:hypothetical protein